MKKFIRYLDLYNFPYFVFHVDYAVRKSGGKKQYLIGSPIETLKENRIAEQIFLKVPGVDVVTFGVHYIMVRMHASQKQYYLYRKAQLLDILRVEGEAERVESIRVLSGGWVSDIECQIVMEGIFPSTIDANYDHPEKCTDSLAYDILNIRGVTRVTISGYVITIYKGKVFQWIELLEDVQTALEFSGVPIMQISLLEDKKVIGQVYFSATSNLRLENIEIPYDFK